MLEKLANDYTGRRTNFYGKALIDKGRKDVILYSYNQMVAKVLNYQSLNQKDHTLVLLPAWDYSNTTIRHVREFVVQFLGGNWLNREHISKRITKAEIKKLAKATAKKN